MYNNNAKVPVNHPHHDQEQAYTDMLVLKHKEGFYPASQREVRKAHLHPKSKKPISAQTLNDYSSMTSKFKYINEEAAPLFKKIEKIYQQVLDIPKRKRGTLSNVKSNKAK